MDRLPRILLAEDDPRDIELTMEAMSAHNLANEVHVVNDGEAALDYLYRRGDYANRADGSPVVVLLDIKMPKLDGLEVLRKIKGDPALRTLPVVMLTSSVMETDLVRSYELGANAYVVKPLKFHDFVDAVGRLGVFWAVLNEPPPGTRAPQSRPEEDGPAP